MTTGTAGIVTTDDAHISLCPISILVMLLLCAGSLAPPLCFLGRRGWRVVLAGQWAARSVRFAPVLPIATSGLTGQRYQPAPCFSVENIF